MQNFIIFNKFQIIIKDLLRICCGREFNRIRLSMVRYSNFKAKKGRKLILFQYFYYWCFYFNSFKKEFQKKKYTVYHILRFKHVTALDDNLGNYSFTDNVLKQYIFESKIFFYLRISRANWCKCGMCKWIKYNIAPPK